MFGSQTLLLPPTASFVKFDFAGFWTRITLPRKEVVVLILLMVLWAALVTLDRYLAFRAARKQSRSYAPIVAGGLRDGRIDETIKIGERHQKSHLAKVLTAGLMEFRVPQVSPGTIPNATIEASRRAMERTAEIVSAELRRGLPDLETIAYTAPWVGLFGTALGIVDALRAVETPVNLEAVASGISDALLTTALGLLAAVLALWIYGHFTEKLKILDLEMRLSSSELIDYFSERSSANARTRS